MLNRRNNKADIPVILLQDKSIKDILKGMIKEKVARYEAILAKWKGLTEEDVENKLDEAITEDSIRLFYDYHEGLDEKTCIERDLTSMCMHLNRSEGKVPMKTNWEYMYDHAKNNVRIENVISGLLGVSDFKRNIHCPFHEDKKPSMKVYPKDNYFICFSCGARGKPINFVMQHQNCSFKEAVVLLSAY